MTKYTKQLRDNPSEESLRQVVRYLRRAKIPDEYQFWGILREAYEVVLTRPEKFAPETVEEFIVSLRRRGVKWVR